MLSKLASKNIRRAASRSFANVIAISWRQDAILYLQKAKRWSHTGFSLSTLNMLQPLSVNTLANVTLNAK